MNKICFVEIPIVSEKQFKLNALSTPVGDSYDVWEPGLSSGICYEYKSIMFLLFTSSTGEIKTT